MKSMHLAIEAGNSIRKAGTTTRHFKAVSMQHIIDEQNGFLLNEQCNNTSSAQKNNQIPTMRSLNNIDYSNGHFKGISKYVVNDTNMANGHYDRTYLNDIDNTRMQLNNHSLNSMIQISEIDKHQASIRNH